MISDASRLEEFREGEVLVTDKTDPDWEPTMKKAAAIVTNPKLGSHALGYRLPSEHEAAAIPPGPAVMLEP